MTDQPSISNTIRSELVDTATEFLKNPKIIGEQMERKREFLRKKGLTDTEINYAFQLIPQQETTKEIISNHPPSFLYRFFKDFIFAGCLVLAIKLIKQSFHSNEKNELNETIKTLQKSVRDMQTSVVKLEQTADLLNLNMQTLNINRSSSLSIEQIKQELQGLKGLFSSRIQVPSKIPSWQSNMSDKIKTNQTTTDSDNDGIIVISEHDKRSDDENLSSNDN